MKSPAMLAAAAITLMAGLSPSIGNGAIEGRPMDKGAGSKKELYAVVQIGDEVKVVKKSELTGLKKSTAEEDKRRKKEYDEAKKGGGKNKDLGRNLGTELGMDLGRGMDRGMDRGLGKDPANLQKPVKRTVKILKNSLKSQQDAEDWLQKYMEEREEPGAKKKTATW